MAETPVVHIGSGRTNPDLWAARLRLESALAPTIVRAPSPDGTDRHYDRMMAADEARWAHTMPTCYTYEEH